MREQTNGVVIRNRAFVFEAVETGQFFIAGVAFDIRFLKPLIGGFKAVIVCDDGVDTPEITNRSFRQGSGIATNVLTLLAGGNLRETIELLLGDEVGLVRKA